MRSRRQGDGDGDGYSNGKASAAKIPWALFWWIEQSLARFRKYWWRSRHYLASTDGTADPPARTRVYTAQSS